MTVDSDAVGETIQNYAWADSPGQDPVIEEGPIEPEPGGGVVESGQDTLALEKTATDVNGVPLQVGDEIAYVITVTNLLTETNPNVVLTDSVPLYTTYVTDSAKTEGQLTGPDPFVVDYGDLGASAVVTFAFRVKVGGDAMSQTVQNFATVDSDTQDPPLEVGPVEPTGEGGGDADKDGILDKDEDVDGDGDPGNDDSDEDGIPNYLDPDDDNDGILTKNECPAGIPCPNTDGDDKPNHLDPDDDDDNIPTKNECPGGTDCPDTDKDNTPDHLDPDDDGDGTDTKDECPQGPACPDEDEDNIPDYLEPDNKDTDDDGQVDENDPDDDGDNIPTEKECPEGPVCPDSDGDGTPDYLDDDADDDGLKDQEECPNGAPCPDEDNDNVPDYLEPNTTDTDGDSTNNNQDPDDDGDGIPTAQECPNGPTCPDTDDDGIPDYLDDDSDGDGDLDSEECPDSTACPDGDEDGVPDYLDPNDKDTDDDGTVDEADLDDDGDGIPTSQECPDGPECPDTDGDGTPDYLDDDSDNDGETDAEECPDHTACPDGDEDNVPDYLEPDDVDRDHDTYPNENDPDDDGDGIPTAQECPNGPVCPDTDGDDIPDYLDPVGNRPPVAVAGPDRTLPFNALVKLDGSNSSDPNGDALSYDWQQTGGLPVTLTHDVSVTTFTAPNTTTVLAFALTVTDTYGEHSTDNVVITITEESDADLSITKSVTRTVYMVTYTVVVKNQGPADASGAVVHDEVIDHVYDVVWTCEGSGGAACTPTGSGNLLHDTIPQFPSGSVITYTIVGHIPPLGTEVNAAQVFAPDWINDPDLSNNLATVGQPYRIMLIVVLKTPPE